MTQLYTFAILLLLLLPAVGSSQTKEEKRELKEAFARRDKYLFAAKPSQKNFTITIPYTSQHDQIIVPVTIKGETYHFLFDTGAATLVSLQLKEKLGLQAAFSNKLVDGAGHVQEEAFYGIGSVEFAGVTFNNVYGPAIDMGKFEKLFCVKLDGILGTNIMRNCRWKIDYSAKTITFSDKKIKPAGKVREIDFIENFSGSPLLRQVVGEYSFYSIMDTGYNGSFTLPDSLFFKSRISKKLHYAKGIGNSALTLYDSKPSNEYAVVLDSIYIGNFLVNNRMAHVVTASQPLTGNEVFRDFGTVIIDWDKLKIYVPDAPYKEDKEMVTFGFSPVYAEGTLRVGMVWDDASAGRQGLEVGDTILSINGKNTKDLPQQEWCEIMEAFTDKGRVQAIMQLTLLKRDGTQKQVQLVKTDLFRK